LIGDATSRTRRTVVARVFQTALSRCYCTEEFRHRVVTDPMMWNDPGYDIIPGRKETDA
jgi:hypothetical protein